MKFKRADKEEVVKGKNKSARSIMLFTTYSRDIFI